MLYRYRFLAFDRLDWLLIMCCMQMTTVTIVAPRVTRRRATPPATNGEYKYKEVSVPRQRRGEVLCTHCDDSVSRTALRQHMHTYWDDENDQWTEVRYHYLPQRVLDKYKPYQILGEISYSLSICVSATDDDCTIGLVRNKHQRWVEIDWSHDNHDRHRRHALPIDDLSLGER